MVNYPWYAWLLVLIGVVGLPALTAVGLYRVGLRAGAVVFALVWSVWIVTSALLAEGGAYRQLPDASRPWIGVAAGGAVAALMAAAGIPAVRGAFANPGNLAALTWPQSLRVVGAVFLIAMALGGLPAAFALPAGLGDVAVGIGAVFVARRLTRGDRSGASWFNVLGLFDLVLAVKSRLPGWTRPEPGPPGITIHSGHWPTATCSDPDHRRSVGGRPAPHVAGSAAPTVGSP